MKINDFRDFTDEEVFQFVLSHKSCFGGRLSFDFPNKYLEQGNRVHITRHEFGFAIFVKELDRPNLGIRYEPAKLAFLYADKEKRGRGVGRYLVSKIIQEFGNSKVITLECFGTQRRRYFRKCGFSVTYRRGKFNKMQYDKSNSHVEWVSL
nr:GNAT family N-acetyltransferase [uncultured Undibacterium sp.]